MSTVPVIKIEPGDYLDGVKVEWVEVVKQWGIRVKLKGQNKPLEFFLHQTFMTDDNKHYRVHQEQK